MSGGGTQSSLRRTLGAIKDSTSVNLAKINSDYKEVDIAVVKATNHVERPAKEKHIRAVFSCLSATQPRADVAYCIHALDRRLSKTQNWAVALKTLIVIHRALREMDPTFQEELTNYIRSRGQILNLVNFKDDSSPKGFISCRAWDYSAWVRCYALYLEERLECYRVLKYDVEADRSKTKDFDTPELLEHLPYLQQLLFRILGCQPQGAAVLNYIIQLGLSLVSLESIKIYHAISDGTVNLVDKFFEMQRPDALRALDIYRRASVQAERLSEFYEICKNLDIQSGERYVKIEQPPSSFLQAMEEYVREASRGSAVRRDSADEKPKAILAIEYNRTPEVKVEQPPSPPPPNPERVVEPVKVEVPATEEPDLLGLNDPLPAASELDEKNALALAIVPIDQPVSTGQNLVNGTTGWELALVTAPSSNGNVVPSSKSAGGLDKFTLDSLYDDAIRIKNQQNISCNPWQPAPVVNSMMPQIVHNPFHASNAVSSPHFVQMGSMTNQQQAFMYYQQQQMMMGQYPMMVMGSQPPTNPFGNTHVAGAHQHPHSTVMPVQANNPYSGLI